MHNMDSTRCRVTNRSAVSLSRVVICLVLMALPALGGTVEAKRKSLTIWLMPSEPADSNKPVDGSAFEGEIEEFNKRLPPHVVVLDTIQPLRQQLIAWNSEFAVPNWAFIRSQYVTL